MQDEEFDPETGEIAPRPRMGEDGLEYLSPDPVAIPARYRRPQSQLDLMRDVVREMSARAQEHEMETWEEANDFDIGDDYEPRSAYEVDDTHEDNYESDRREYYNGKRAPQRDRDGKTRVGDASADAGPRNPDRSDDIQPGGQGHSVKGARAGKGKRPPSDPDVGTPDGVTQ